MKYRRVFPWFVFLLAIGTFFPLTSNVALAEDDWCDRAGGGSAGTNLAVDLSAAHAGARFFGVQAKYSIADQALATAVNPPTALSTGGLGTLQSYSQSLGGVCVAPDNPATLGPVQVFRLGELMLIRPGTGSVQIPSDVSLVAIDLRDLPELPGLRAALEATVAPALKNPVARPTRTVRRHLGLTDEVLASVNFYGNSLTQLSQPDIPGQAQGGQTITLAFLTGQRTAPGATEFAGTLRLARKAWLIGYDLFSSVAESRWQGVGTASETGYGLLYRVEDLNDGRRRWPDSIPADVRTDNPNLDDLRRILRGLGTPSQITGPANRASLQQVAPFRDIQPATFRLGDFRAQLLVFHGATRLFFPYFPVVGDNMDPRLLETLGSLGSGPTVDRKQAFRALRRLSEALKDGHVVWFNFAPPLFAGGLFEVLESIGGEPVVRVPFGPEMQKGETITSIGGMPAVDWFADEMSRASAATDGYRFRAAYTQGELWRMTGPLEFTFRELDGSTRIATIPPWTGGGIVNSAWSNRPEGFLTDLGAPSIYFLNFSPEVIGSDQARFDAAVDAAINGHATAMILDLRVGKSGSLSQAFLSPRLICTHFSSMTYNVPVWDGPDNRSVFSTHYELDPVNPYCGPLVVLVSPLNISNGEDFLEQILGAHRVTKVVGRQSAGTNGNVTGVQLPGGTGHTFTGMEVRNVDGSVFHGVGIVPDIVVDTYTAQDFATDRDRDLEAALQFLQVP